MKLNPSKEFVFEIGFKFKFTSSCDCMCLEHVGLKARNLNIKIKIHFCFYKCLSRQMYPKCIFSNGTFARTMA